MTSGSSDDLEAIRSIILGKEREQVKSSLDQHARELVSQVVSEALYDREQKDHSVNKILVPLVEKSVEHSVNTRSDQMIGALYPLVGSLVRKSVSSFFADFMQKTNRLIENSFTWRGLTWRYQAWRQGISFSKYLACKTFDFRVEQVFLIHSETGLLLKSISVNEKSAADADLISSMLTAINDFVSDSFHPSDSAQEQSLSVVKTNDFTLVIKPGPSAMIVGAVVGTVPEVLSQEFDVALEEVHQLYYQQLAEYNGDNQPFDAADSILRQCLVSQLAEPEEKKPWMAAAVLGSFLLFFMSIAILRSIQVQQLAEIRKIDQEFGIVLISASLSGWNGYKLKLMRDSAAIDVNQWMLDHEISVENLTLHEMSFISNEEEIVKRKVMEKISLSAGVSYQNDTGILMGNLSFSEFRNLQLQLSSIPGITDVNHLMSGINITSVSKMLARSDERNFDVLVGQLNKTVVEFPIDSHELDDDKKSQLNNTLLDIEQLLTLADKLNKGVMIIVIGVSDGSGNRYTNQNLSEQRALSVKQFLLDKGLSSKYIRSFGIGEISNDLISSHARSTLFSVLLTSEEDIAELSSVQGGSQ